MNDLLPPRADNEIVLNLGISIDLYGHTVARRFTVQTGTADRPVERCAYAVLYPDVLASLRTHRDRLTHDAFITLRLVLGQTVELLTTQMLRHHLLLHRGVIPSGR